MEHASPNHQNIKEALVTSHQHRSRSVFGFLQILDRLKCTEFLLRPGLITAQEKARREKAAELSQDCTQLWRFFCGLLFGLSCLYPPLADGEDPGGLKIGKGIEGWYLIIFWINTNRSRTVFDSECRCMNFWKAQALRLSRGEERNREDYNSWWEC